MPLSIRDVCEQELPQVLALNNAAGPSVLPLDRQRLAELFATAPYFRVAEIDGHLAGFLIALSAHTAYDGANFRWFSGRYPDFVYIDRIVVAASYRRLGLGRIFYADVQSFAEVRSPLLACEIFLEPRDDAAVLFHGTYGFCEVGQQQLAGRRVLVRDVNGVEKPARLLFAAPAQINYVTPEGLANGPAVIRVLDENNNTLRTGLALLQQTAPGIFTANADGHGAAAAVVVRVRPGNVQSYEPVTRFDEALKRYVPAEIDLGPEPEVLVLSLFGTGWRQAASPAIVNVNIGNDATGYALCPVEYIGAQPTLDGLDQINVRLSRALLGKGDVSVAVSINGVSMNLVQLKIR